MKMGLMAGCKSEVAHLKLLAVICLDNAGEQIATLALKFLIDLVIIYLSCMY